MYHISSGFLLNVNKNVAIHVHCCIQLLLHYIVSHVFSKSCFRDMFNFQRFLFVIRPCCSSVLRRPDNLRRRRTTKRSAVTIGRGSSWRHCIAAVAERNRRKPVGVISSHTCSCSRGKSACHLSRRAQARS